MIRENSTNAWWLLRDGWRNVLGVYAIVAAAEIANDLVDLSRPTLSLAAAGLMVTAISIFLVFRVGEAYSRWWEARTLWGGIVNGSRTFARQALSLVGSLPGSADAAEREALQRELVYRQIAWCHALRASLRRDPLPAELDGLIGDEERAGLAGFQSPANRLMQIQSERLVAAQQAGRLSDIELTLLDRSMAGLTDMQGGCERIKNTAFPDHVVWISRTFAWLLATLLAIAILDKSNYFDWIDFLVVPLIMLSFIVTERVGSELRNPFEGRANDTPMTALCRTIEIDLRQMLGETDVPPPLEPVDGVLL